VVTTDATMEFDEALGIAVQEDGKLVAAGKFRMDNNINFGVVRYMNELTVSLPEISKSQGISISPNPVRNGGTINISMEIPESQAISMEVVNIAGEVVAEISLGLKTEGIIMESIGLPSDLTGGIYFIRIHGTQSAFISRKIIVVE